MTNNTLMLLLFVLGVLLVASGVYLIRHNRKRQANVASFLYSLTHDHLSNPIQSAQAATDNLERWHSSLPVANRATSNETLTDLKHALKRLFHTSHDLRQLALLEIDSRTRLSERINLVALAQHLVLEFGPEADKLGVQLLYEGDSKPITLLQQRDYVRHILANVLHNAIKYSTGITDGCVVLGITQSGTSAIVTVSDNGPGISAAQLRSLTTKPQRKSAHNVGKSGSGLGLYLTQRLVAECRGKLSFDNQQGRGTVVTIVFPVAPASD